jgi:hypothetical protein
MGTSVLTVAPWIDCLLAGSSLTVGAPAHAVNSAVMQIAEALRRRWYMKLAWK